MKINIYLIKGKYNDNFVSKIKNLADLIAYLFVSIRKSKYVNKFWKIEIFWFYFYKSIHFKYSF